MTCKYTNLQEPYVAKANDIQITSSNLIMVAGYPIGRLVNGHVIFLDRDKKRCSQHKRGRRIYMPIKLFEELTKPKK